MAYIIKLNEYSDIPKYCRNCLHQTVCGIQSPFKEEEIDVSKYNTDHANINVSITSVAFNCTHKLI